MKERTFTLTNGAQPAIAIMVALLLALAALVLSTEPAEAVQDINGGGGQQICYGCDVASPYVTSTYPADYATGIALNANVTATFSERMDPDTIFSGSTGFSLRKAGSYTGTSTYVSATVTYDSATKKATLNPNGDLQGGTTYVARVSTVATDLAGNPLDQITSKAGNQDMIWNFTTVAKAMTGGGI